MSGCGVPFRGVVIPTAKSTLPMYLDHRIQTGVIMPQDHTTGRLLGLSPLQRHCLEYDEGAM